MRCNFSIYMTLTVFNHDRSDHRSQSSNNNPTPSPSSLNLSTSGAFNGTKLATFNADPEEILTTHIFYQDFAAQIRRLQKERDNWSGGPELPAVVTSGAKNATPLACVNYTEPGTNIRTVSAENVVIVVVIMTDLAQILQAHLFYVNPSDHLQEVISTDDMATWHPGPLGRSNFQSSPRAIAMVALYSETWFGNSMGHSAGLRLYYGGPDDKVQEIAFPLGASSWSPQSVFNDTNGNAGISAGHLNERTGGANLYVWDTQEQVRVWNLNSTVKTNSAVQTYGDWTEGMGCRCSSFRTRLGHWICHFRPVIMLSID